MTTEPTDRLTLREMDVLRGLSKGLSNAEIGTDLGLAEKTVKTHVTAIFRAFKVRNRVEAVLVALGHRRIEQ